MHMHLVGNAVQFTRQIFNGCLDEEDVRRATLRRLPIYLLRDLLQWTCVRIDSDVELVRIPPRRLVYKATVAGPDVDDHTFAGMVR